MRKCFLILILLSTLTGCNFNINYKKIVPEDVDRFATDFIALVHNGKVDSCLTLVLPEMNTEEGRHFLQNSYTHISSLNIDSVKIINATKTSLLGKDGFTNYWIDYEYSTNPRYLYFRIGIRDQRGKLIVTAFDGTIKEESLSKTENFSFKDKGFKHILFFSFVILVPIFIIITLVFAFKTRLNKKWLWIIGILFGFIKFSIDWSTGQIGFSLINISILGTGFTKSGNVAPWILSFSIPIVAIIFWIKRFGYDRTSDKDIRMNDLKTTITEDQN